jgi:hypothetical protein
MKLAKQLSSTELKGQLDQAAQKFTDLSLALQSAEAVATESVATDESAYGKAVSEIDRLGPEVAAASKRVHYLKQNYAAALQREDDQALIDLRRKTWEECHSLRRFNEENFEAVQKAKKVHEELIKKLNAEANLRQNSFAKLRESLHEKLRNRGLDPTIHEGDIHSETPPPDRVKLVN